MSMTKSAFAAAAILIATASGAISQQLSAPEGEVLLTVSGDLSVTNDGDKAVFDLEMLRAMDETTYTTKTPWTDGPQTFTGVSLKALLDELKVKGGSLSATAINDYSIEIPATDAVDGGPIIAYLQNGEEMSVRDKGPLWVIYPYDSSKEYRTEVVYSRSIWQLDRITVSD